MSTRSQGRIVNQKQLSEFIGVSVVSLRAWEDQGMPVLEPGARGRAAKYDTAEVCLWLEDRAAAAAAPKLTLSPADAADAVTLVRQVLAEEGRGIAANGLTLDDAKTAETVLRARSAALQLEKERGTLVELDPVIRHVSSAFNNYKKALQELPARIGAQMAAELGCNVVDLDRVLTRIIHEHLSTLAAPAVRP